MSERSIRTGYWYVPDPASTRGGQHVGSPRGVLVYDETLQLGVLSFSERSQIKNVRDANALLDLAAGVEPGLTSMGPAQRAGAMADALPIDPEAEALVSKLMNRRPDGYTSRKLTRAMDLSAEDVEALRFARRVVGASETLFEDRMSDPKIAGHVERCRAALAVLDQLLGGGSK